MLAKMTSKNQLTLPRRITAAVGDPPYFEVEVQGGRIILTPARIQQADAVRAKLAELGIGPADVAAAVRWARKPGGKGDR
ncbi:MAG TPA: AbrB/MazE/SpoVT family DNA-binding domain-containing protein [Usitatibacteraceae bacterium]|jgi:hypothetical protein|nr:AbrB/MazE/SpoVT family DNA-binding domain-containing protein [Usitatibacteraceae bacterium]HQY47626.1 AbrB/MazE/SpoVT family DNA-binding domain-containing protein [Usitatibacteraceae bacterium]HRA23677.1 AbrB/MazE/SpoVT family DNA-binding domain-containing protein [Usitatibacteraceae bacterium]